MGPASAPVHRVGQQRERGRLQCRGQVAGADGSRGTAYIIQLPRRPVD